MTVDFERGLQAYLVDFYRVRVLDEKGQVQPCHYVREGGKRLLSRWGGFLASSAAYLALTPFEGNPYCGSDELFRLAIDAGERLLVNHAGISRKTKPDHFEIYPLAQLYQRMGDRIDARHRARWRATMARNLDSVDAMIDRVGDNLGKPAPYSGTGPNHYFGWFAVGYHQAKLLEDARLARKIEKAMLRHVAIQAPGGYFPEHAGPATGYQQVSLESLAEFHRLDPLPATGEALRRGIDFAVHAIYPDLRGIETFDERNRLGGYILQHALLWTPRGRNLFARVLTRRHKDLLDASWRRRGIGEVEPLSRSELYRIGSAFRCCEHAAATRGGKTAGDLPIDRDAFTWRLEDKGLVRKHGPWLYALSAYAQETHQGNPYHLERTQALSIYHEKAGLIVGGGNDKRAYHAATVHVLEGNDCHYFPPIGSTLAVGVAPKVLAGDGRCDRLEFDYGSARARIEVRTEGNRGLRIAMDATSTQTKPQIWLVLQLPVAPPVTFERGGKPLRLKPAREDEAEKEYPLGGKVVCSAGWRMTLPKDSALIWPHIPWDPYRPPTYRQVPSAAVALLRVPLGEPDRRVEVTLQAV